jgi:hypothetical protein
VIDRLQGAVAEILIKIPEPPPPLPVGMAARRRLRTLRDQPDASAYKAVRWLPLQYFVWGLVLGYVKPTNRIDEYRTPSRKSKVGAASTMK